MAGLSLLLVCQKGKIVGMVESSLAHPCVWRKWLPSSVLCRHENNAKNVKSEGQLSLGPQVLGVEACGRLSWFWPPVPGGMFGLGLLLSSIWNCNWKYFPSLTNSSHRKIKNKTTISFEGCWTSINFVALLGQAQELTNWNSAGPIWWLTVLLRKYKNMPPALPVQALCTSSSSEAWPWAPYSPTQKPSTVPSPTLNEVRAPSASTMWPQPRQKVVTLEPPVCSEDVLF